MARGIGMQVRQEVPVSEPQAHIDTAARDDDLDRDRAEISLAKLYEIAQAAGQDITPLLTDAQIAKLGTDAVREWGEDKGSCSQWRDDAERYLEIAAQESGDDEPKNYPFDDASDIHYPILTSAALQFNARATPELIKGDKVVGVKVFTPPSLTPSPIQAAKAGPQPQNDQQAQAATQAIQQQEQANAQQDQAMRMRQARGERVKHFLNWTIFYQMDNWEGDTDLLLMQAPVIGSGFKKIYMAPEGLQSDFVTGLRLTVHNDTKSLQRCPRITQEYELYPYEIEERMGSGVFRRVALDRQGSDPQAPRTLLEQHRMDDLDDDGMAEPYIVTVDHDTMQVLRVEPAFMPEDVTISPDGRVVRIDRWNPFASFQFLPDARGRFYGMGLGKLLDTITESIDTTVNQLIDAGNAQIAGGGFIGSGVRLQGSGQGGSVFQRPGEYQMVTAPGMDLRQAIWERTIPEPSAVAFQLLELLLAAAKDIASVKDVITGDAPSTAPVGTTMALQSQALQVFSSIYKRIYRGFKDEFVLMYRCLKRWPNDKIRRQYQELTGGNFDADFAGDGTDIQPVADPSVVTRMQKIARIQTLLQMSETATGMAAGMQQSGPAQAIITEALDAMDYDRPERFLAPVPPNPELVARVQEMQASAALKQAQAQTQGAAANVDRAKALRETGLAALDTHELHVRGGNAQPAPEGGIHERVFDAAEASAQRQHEARENALDREHELDLAKAQPAPAQ